MTQIWKATPPPPPRGFLLDAIRSSECWAKRQRFSLRFHAIADTGWGFAEQRGYLMQSQEKYSNQRRKWETSSWEDRALWGKGKANGTERSPRVMGAFFFDNKWLLWEQQQLKFKTNSHLLQTKNVFIQWARKNINVRPEQTQIQNWLGNQFNFLYTVSKFLHIPVSYLKTRKGNIQLPDIQ